MIEWLNANHGAVVTGGASGIGRAAAKRFLDAGMRVLVADANEAALAELEQDLSGLSGTLVTQPCDVSEVGQVTSLAEVARSRIGKIHCLMNNAGTGFPPAVPWDKLDVWRKQVDINLWGIVHGCQAFIPDMLAHGEAGVVINTGSKQGITNPPGNYAYNLSKAGVKAYTESVAHALRETEGARLSAHLLIPGFTYTGMIARFVKEQPAGAWAPEQVVEFMLEALAAQAFYILCPDNETPRALDAKRIQWNTDDVIKGRSALSRWDPAYKDDFEAFIAED